MALKGPATCGIIIYFIAIVAGASAQAGEPPVQSIIARIAQARSANRARLRRYVVRRDYELFGKERSKATAQVVAEVTFVPPDLKKYVIQHANGAGLGEKVVRLMLENETEVAKDNRSSDITPENYDFRLIREEKDLSGQNCYVLELLPKRKDKKLINGNIWVDARTYLFRRIDGKLAKTPSWWLREVRLQVLYSEVSGMWLPTKSEATGDVRILGPHTMVARDVNYDVGDLIVDAPPALAASLERQLDQPLRDEMNRLDLNNPLMRIKDWIWIWPRRRAGEIAAEYFFHELTSNFSKPEEIAYESRG